MPGWDLTGAVCTGGTGDTVQEITLAAREDYLHIHQHSDQAPGHPCKGG